MASLWGGGGVSGEGVGFGGIISESITPIVDGQSRVEFPLIGAWKTVRSYCEISI